MQRIKHGWKFEILKKYCKVLIENLKKIKSTLILFNYFKYEKKIISYLNDEVLSA